MGRIQQVCVMGRHLDVGGGGWHNRSPHAMTMQGSPLLQNRTAN